MPKQQTATVADEAPRLHRIYNVSPYPLAPSHDRLAVLPGDGVDLPEPRATELLSFPDWSETDPRAVPSRPAETHPRSEPEPVTSNEPAESGDHQEMQ